MGGAALFVIWSHVVVVLLMSTVPISGQSLDGIDGDNATGCSPITFFTKTQRLYAEKAEIAEFSFLVVPASSGHSGGGHQDQDQELEVRVSPKFYDESLSKCISKIESLCLADGDCGEGAKCTPVVEWHHYFESVQKLEEFLPVDTTKYPLLGTCQCPQTTTLPNQLGTGCIDKLKFGAICNDSSQCAGLNLECTDNRCSCPTRHALSTTDLQNKTYYYELIGQKAEGVDLANVHQFATQFVEKDERCVLESMSDPCSGSANDCPNNQICILPASTLSLGWRVGSSGPEQRRSSSHVGWTVPSGTSAPATSWGRSGGSRSGGRRSGGGRGKGRRRRSVSRQQPSSADYYPILGTCGCPAKQRLNESTLICVAKARVGEACSEVERRCEPTYKCGSDGRCTCAQVGDVSVGHACLRGANSSCDGQEGAGQTCVKNALCTLSERRRSGTHMAAKDCTCNEGYVASRNGLCLAGYLGQCDSHTDCNSDQGLRCLDGFCKCRDLANQIYDPHPRVSECRRLLGSKCDPRISRGGSKCVERAGCVGGVCECGPGAKRTSASTCGVLEGHGQVCRDGACDHRNGLACIENYCNCVDEGLVVRNGSCLAPLGSYCGNVGPVGSKDLESGTTTDKHYFVGCDVGGVCEAVDVQRALCKNKPAPP